MFVQNDSDLRTGRMGYHSRFRVTQRHLVLLLRLDFLLERGNRRINLLIGSWGDRPRPTR